MKEIYLALVRQTGRTEDGTVGQGDNIMPLLQAMKTIWSYIH